jgi:hypothetical protein
MFNGLQIPLIIAAIAAIVFGLVVIALIMVRRSPRFDGTIAATSVARRPLTKDQYAAQQTAFTDNQLTLQQRFVSIVSQSGKPKGLTWKSCKFDKTTHWVIEKQSANLHALLSTVIHFNAIPGDSMEDVPAVGNARIATAIFFYDGQRWDTRGDVLFNLEPHDVLIRHCNDYDLYQ